MYCLIGDSAYQPLKPHLGHANSQIVAGHKALAIRVLHVSTCHRAAPHWAVHVVWLLLQHCSSCCIRPVLR